MKNNWCAATVHEVAGLVCARAPNYFPDLARERTTVSVVHQAARRHGSLVELQVTDGVQRVGVFVKLPSPIKPTVDYPQRFSKADHRGNGLHEFHALTAICDHFTASGDDRFGAIRVLDVLGPTHVLILERAHDPSFYQVFCKTNRWQRQSHQANVRAGLRNAGAWLHQFHEFPALLHTQARNARREAYMCFIKRITEFLEEGGQGPQMLEVGEELAHIAERVLPEDFPLGLSHNDYAPRNMLLGGNGRVTVFDTQGRWQAPIYEDLAHYLIALKAAAPHVYSRGLLWDQRTLTGFENEFLQGYFGEQPVPLPALRLFEAQLMLEWWGELLARSRTAGRLPRFVKQWRLALWRRHLWGYLRDVMEDLRT